MINRLPLPEYFQLNDKKPWETKMFDTLNWWKFGDNKNYVSLHLLASVLGIPTSKTDIDGSMVGRVFWEEHDIERIVKYCEKDVVAIVRLLQRMKGESLVPEESVISITWP